MSFIILYLYYSSLIHAWTSLQWKRPWKEQARQRAKAGIVPPWHCTHAPLLIKGHHAAQHPSCTRREDQLGDWGSSSRIWMFGVRWDRCKGHAAQLCDSAWFPGTDFVLKTDCNSGRKKAFVTCIYTLTWKVLHVEASSSTAYLHRLKILFHLGKIMSFSNLLLVEQAR